MRAIGFCHLLLQSRAPVSRSLLARSLPHARGQLRFPLALPVRRRTSEHPAVSRRQSDCGGCRMNILRSSNHCRACRASSMCQLADPSVVAHTSKLRLERCATRSVKTSPFCDPARLPSKSAFLRPTSCDACRAPPGVDLMSRACPAFVGFAANVPSSTPFHRYDAMLLSQTRLYRLGPRSHPRI
jgi:hypothetical protein